MTKRTRQLRAGVVLVVAGVIAGNVWATNVFASQEFFESTVDSCVRAGGPPQTCVCVAETIAREGNLITWLRMKVSLERMSREYAARCAPISGR